MIRINSCSIVVGHRGCGKTDFEKRIILASPMKRKLIVDLFDAPVWHNFKTFDNPSGENHFIPEITEEDFSSWTEGTRRMITSDMEKTLHFLVNSIFNTLLILEDSERYINSRGLTPFQRRFVIETKQKNCDLITNFHLMKKIPEDLLALADDITIFKTKENVLRPYHAEKFTDEALAAWHRVKKAKPYNPEYIEL